MHFLIKSKWKETFSVLALPDPRVCSLGDKEKELCSHLAYLIQAAGGKASIASDCKN